MITLAITGGLSSGKSTVAELFRKKGGYVVDTDKVAHNLLKNNKACRRKILKTFGTKILKNGKIDRKKLAEIVFNSSTYLTTLEKILHPLIFAQLESLRLCVQKKGFFPYFVVEYPLLFELEKDSEYDRIITVLSDESKAKLRYRGNDYSKRMQRQINPKLKAERSNFVIKNHGSVQELEQQVEQIIGSL